MPDLHDSLENEARRVRSEPGALGAVLERASRRRRAKRIATGALALVVAGAGFGLAYAAFRTARQVEPGGLPVPGPTPSALATAIAGLIVTNHSGIQGASEFAVARLGADGIIADVVVVPPEGREERTAIFCHPLREDEAIDLRDRFFPGAVLRPRIDPEFIEVRIGRDFIEANANLFDAFAVVRSFMTRRVEGAGAEAFLAGDADDDFNMASGPSLYGYIRGGAFDIAAVSPVVDGTTVIEVVIVTPEGGDAVVLEHVTVGEAGGQQMILAGELATPFDEVQVFVDSFLEARRTASGAGTYLGEEAREAFATHEGGLDLLQYAANRDLRFARVIKYDKVSPEQHRVVVLFVLSRPGPGQDEPRRILEALTIERLGEDGWVVADVERVSSA